MALKTSELTAFLAIVDAGSMTRAAGTLRIPRATLGQRLARLEERLGAQLVQRTTRTLSLTDEGRAFERAARVALESIRAAEMSIQHPDDVLRGNLRVSLPPSRPGGLHRFVLDFAQRYPSVRVQAHVATRHVDLRRDGYDVAIRAGAASGGDGLKTRTLIPTRLIALASPAYLEAYGTPRRLSDLASHRCLMGFDHRELPARDWLGAKGNVAMQGAFFSNDMEMLRQAALDGLGIAMLPDVFVQQALAKDHLRQVLPRQLMRKTPLRVVYVDRAFVPAHVRVFVDEVVEFSKAMVSRMREC